MLSLDQGTIYGNLYAYKLYTRPTARRLFGAYSYHKKSLPKHYENVQQVLEILALNGSLTTWGMAKIQMHNDLSKIRTKEKEYRRLLVGRRDRGKKTSGVLDVGLVVKDGKSYVKGPSDLYRLSLHGVLYCLDVLDLTNRQIDVMASRYSHVLPWLFGKWDYIKSIMGNGVYRLKILASGLFLDNIQITSVSKFPVYEIMTYISVKYQNNFEYITETDLADQISFWFYTHLLVPSKLSSKSKESSIEVKKWKKIFSGDKDLQKWYYNFLNEATDFYKKRFSTIKQLKI